MKVLITGGNGFIGNAVVVALVRAGHRVAVLDRPGDVRDAISVQTSMYGCEAVIHLAGLLGTDELFDRAAEAVDVNVIGTVNVLDACVKHGARYVGITMPAAFPSIYTATKKGAAAIEEAYRHNYGLHISKVRAFNAYGPGQNHGEGHPQKIIPTFAAKAWAGEPIPIWGDGEQTADLVHVDDLAKMLVEALQFDHVTFDAGTGVGLSVNEIADFVLAVTGSEAGVEHLPMRRGEVPTKIVAGGEGWDKLTWRPTFSWKRLADVVHAYRPMPSPSTIVDL